MLCYQVLLRFSSRKGQGCFQIRQKCDDLSRQLLLSSRFKGFLRLLVREDVKSLLRLDKSEDLSSADEGNRSLSLDVNTLVVVENSSAASSIKADADVFFALDSAMSPFVEPGNSSPLTLMACKCTKHCFTFLNFTFEQNHSFYEPLINSLVAVIEKS